MASLNGRAFEYIGAGTVSNVAPAATSQRNSCEMSRWYKREQNSREHAFSGGETFVLQADGSRDRLDEFSVFVLTEVNGSPLISESAIRRIVHTSATLRTAL